MCGYKRVEAVQQTAGSLVHVPVLELVNSPAGTQPCECTRQYKGAEGVVSAFEISPIAFLKVSQIGVFRYVVAIELALVI